MTTHIPTTQDIRTLDQDTLLARWRETGWKPRYLRDWADEWEAALPTHVIEATRLAADQEEELHRLLDAEVERRRRVAPPLPWTYRA